MSITTTAARGTAVVVGGRGRHCGVCSRLTLLSEAGFAR
jgi:hypothetical protein